MTFENTLAFAQKLDAADELRKYREQFYFPQHNGQNVLYYTGNSLGLQPKQTQQYIQQELNDWAKLGVEGHFEAKIPWFSYHEQLSKPLAMLTGAKESEVVAMNQLTSNIHFLFISFYRPTAKRYKIICEAKAFPSDQYLIETQVQHHGFKPEDAIIEVSPRAGEHYIRHEDIIKTIQQHGESVALVFIGGVNYLSGQVFDMAAITQAAHGVGANAGFDLAHGIGNIKLELHKWNVDFAAWCSYKYLNSGPGSVGGVFVHEKHHNSNLPRLAGWWGHDKATRFKMEKGFNPITSAEGWQLSNAPVLSMAAHKAALDIFVEAGMEKLLSKSKLLTNYLEFIINEVNVAWKQKNENLKLEIVTQQIGDMQRGCQLSIIAHGMGKELHTQLTKQGVIADWREPNVIRFAPAPLYNSFEDVFRLGEILLQIT